MSESLTEQQRQIIRNEALFRQVNDRLNDLNETLSGHSGTMELVCECGSMYCLAQVPITISEYEHLRSDPSWFAIIPGHDVAGVERVIANGDGYDIVQKRVEAVAYQAQEAEPGA